MVISLGYKDLTCILMLLLIASISLLWDSGIDAFPLSLEFELNESSQIMATILYEIRIPRLLVAGICGAGLAGAGVLSQALFRNALASPSVLGISSAGTFCACLVFYLDWTWSTWFALPFAAFLGACLNTLVVFSLTRYNQVFQTDRLLLAGLALSSLWGAFTSLLISVSLEDYQKLNSMMHWMLGGFSGLGWEHLKFCSFPISISLFFAFRMCPQLNLLSLGSEYATSLSVSVPKLKTKVLIVIGILVAVIVSLAGMLPFVGLLVPHLTRLIVGPEHKRLFLLSVLNGSSLTILADLFARKILAPIEMDVGVFTALMGAPFFLIMLWKRNGAE